MMRWRIPLSWMGHASNLPATAPGCPGIPHGPAVDRNVRSEDRGMAERREYSAGCQRGMTDDDTLSSAEEAGEGGLRDGGMPLSSAVITLLRLS